MGEPGMRVGLDPKLPDGTVSLLLHTGTRSLQMSIEWRAALGLAAELSAWAARAATIAGVAEADVMQAAERVMTEVTQAHG